MDCLRTSDAHPLHGELLDLLTAPDLLEQAVSACSMCATRAQRSGTTRRLTARCGRMCATRAQRSGCTLTAQYYKRKLSLEREDGDMEKVHREEYETRARLCAVPRKPA